jgi:hypothetical protein
MFPCVDMTSLLNSLMNQSKTNRYIIVFVGFISTMIMSVGTHKVSFQFAIAIIAGEGKMNRLGANLPDRSRQVEKQMPMSLSLSLVGESRPRDKVIHINGIHRISMFSSVVNVNCILRNTRQHGLFDHKFSRCRPHTASNVFMRLFVVYSDTIDICLSCVVITINFYRSSYHSLSCRAKQINNEVCHTHRTRTIRV